LRAAKAMIKFSIFTEIFFSIFYVLCTIIFINITGLRGTVIAYSINYFLYFLAMYFFIYLRLEKIV
jgi:PST family polysaccharide transporter